MKISLIYPLLSKDRSKVDENKQYWPPLGIAYIAAKLMESGHKVQIIDRDLLLRKNKLDFSLTNKLTLEKILAFGSETVGISATTPNISDVIEISSFIKKNDSSIVTVLGGPHITGEPFSTLRLCSDIDIAVRGEGEETLLEIAEGISLEKVKGITYKAKNGEIINNENRPLINDIDSLPLPSRSLLEMKFYTRPSRFTSRNLSLRTTHIFTARGCPYNCHYCAGPLMGNNKVRYHSPQRVLKEIKELIEVYAVEAIYFAEDMFLSKKQRAKELLELFIENGINKKIVWMAQLNAKVADSNLLALMKEAGCIHIEYGFESGSQRILDLMNKKTTVGQNSEAAMLTKKMGIRFQGNFIIGYPGEKEDDFIKTIDFIKRVKPSQVSVNMFMPLPGTYIYKKLKEEGKLLAGWDDIGNQDAPQLSYADMPKAKFEEMYFRTRLFIIIPMNLKNFIADNISSPFRLFYIIISQSLGMSIKILRSIKKLYRLK